MKTLFVALALLLPLFARALPSPPEMFFYSFASLSGDQANGTAPVSQTDYDTGVGPHYFAGDRSNDPFTFSFNTTIGTVFYLDYFGFGFSLSGDRNSLYANGSIAQRDFMGGFIFANFFTDLNGITSWTGGYERGGQSYAASGTGVWAKEGFTPTAIMVPDTGTTIVLLAASLAVFLIFRKVGTIAPRRPPHPR